MMQTKYECVGGISAVVTSGSTLWFRKLSDMLQTFYQWGHNELTLYRACTAKRGGFGEYFTKLRNFGGNNPMANHFVCTAFPDHNYVCPLKAAKCVGVLFSNSQASISAPNSHRRVLIMWMCPLIQTRCRGVLCCESTQLASYLWKARSSLTVCWWPREPAMWRGVLPLVQWAAIVGYEPTDYVCQYKS